MFTHTFDNGEELWSMEPLDEASIDKLGEEIAVADAIRELFDGMGDSVFVDENAKLVVRDTVLSTITRTRNEYWDSLEAGTL